MSGINSASIAQQETLSLKRSVEVNYERTQAAAALNISVDRADPIPSENFQKIFDVVDISDEAQEELLRNKQNADALAEYVRRGRGIEIRVVPPKPGKVQIAVSAESVKESFSITESISLSLERSTSVEVSGDAGSISAEQTQSIDVTLSRTVEFLSSSSQVSLSSGLTA